MFNIQKKISSYNKRKEILKKNSKLNTILRDESPYVTYDNDDTFDLLQSKYTPRLGYKYDYYNCWLRAVNRVKNILKVSENLQKKDISFLELACGDGMASFILSNYGHKGTCHDLEDWRLPEAKKISFIQADLAQPLPMQNQQYDLIFSFNSFEHIPDPKLTLDEVARVTKPGAIVYIEFSPLFNSPWGLHAYKTIFMPYPQFLFSERYYLNQLKKLGINDLGQEREELQPLNKWKFTDFDSLWKHPAFSVIEKKYARDESHLDIILQYPDAFKGRGLTIDEVTQHGVQIVLERRTNV